ncbi:MAG: hypothetical protein K1060chlam1_00478 [Candidatus Anoxychlamydiales bacterium]|nr:hypothetical protein [Candidatus Anoxychlamydiales bacterium]
MSVHIKVTNRENDFSWEKDLTASRERTQVHSSLSKGSQSAHLFKACVYPIRTHNLLDFSKDFFLPHSVNHTIDFIGKVQNIAGKIFLMLASLVFDIVTFPLRLLTFIPRIISNSQQKPIPFYEYLKGQNVDPKLLEANWVRVELSWFTNQPPPGYDLFAYYAKSGSIKKNINFIELPDNDVNDSRGEIEEGRKFEDVIRSTA